MMTREISDSAKILTVLFVEESYVIASETIFCLKLAFRVYLIELRILYISTNTTKYKTLNRSYMRYKMDFSLNCFCDVTDWNEGHENQLQHVLLG